MMGLLSAYACACTYVLLLQRNVYWIMETIEYMLCNVHMYICKILSDGVNQTSSVNSSSFRHLHQLTVSLGCVYKTCFVLGFFFSFSLSPA